MREQVPKMCSEKAVFNYLYEIGCCKYCCLRYFCNRAIDFSSIDEYIQKWGFLSDNNSDEHQEIKKCKANPCIVCLGLLQDHVLDDTVTAVMASEVLEYDTKVFTCSVSIPACILIRERLIRIDIRNRFPNFFSDDAEEVALNKTWKLLIKNKLSPKLNKDFENSDTCEFSINVVMDYLNDREELTVMKKLAPKKVPGKKNDIYSRKSIVNVLTDCKLDEMKAITVQIPTNFVVCKSVTCKQSPVYVAGRYCKYSRELSQSPWIIDGVKTMETSVQEIIFEKIVTCLGIPEGSLKFSSSGREDCDVRCLGKGRPFYIQISDSKKTMFTFEELRKLQENINVSELIQVRDLQLVNRDELGNLKEGEEKKTKEYSALCVSKNPLTQTQIDKLNSCDVLQLNQKTPIRVLHRRPIATRKRKIYRMSAALLGDNHKNLFELNVETEAGTYVKEFVHGDFGRTKPSVGDLINDEVDIIALDVLAINLDWPKEIVHQIKSEC